MFEYKIIFRICVVCCGIHKGYFVDNKLILIVSIKVVWYKKIFSLHSTIQILQQKIILYTLQFSLTDKSQSAILNTILLPFLDTKYLYT